MAPLLCTRGISPSLVWSSPDHTTPSRAHKRTPVPVRTVAISPLLLVTLVLLSILCMDEHSLVFARGRVDATRQIHVTGTTETTTTATAAAAAAAPSSSSSLTATPASHERAARHTSFPPSLYPPATYPKTYVNYILQEGQQIVIDGMLNDTAWEEVAWTENFLDIQGPTLPTPWFVTRAKLRWDNDTLYVGAYLQETEVWANMTQHDSVVFQDNDFELFIDPDGSTHHYKELEINAINTTWDLMLNKPYLNGGSANSSWEMPTMRSAIYVDGGLNDPSVPDRFWSVEMALPLKDYVDGCKSTVPPRDGDYWRFDFSRVEYKVSISGSHYVKNTSYPAQNWVWQPMWCVDMHQPERWGYMQYSTEAVNTTDVVEDQTWPQRAVLAQVYYAEMRFSVTNGYYTDQYTLLDVPEYVYNGTMNTKPPVISCTDYSFNVTVFSLDPSLPVGTINDQRYIEFLSSE